MSLAYTVQQRVREFGIRLALGARPGAVLRQVLGMSAAIAAGGAVVGLVIAGLGGGAMSRVLYGVRPLDPVTFAAVVLCLGATAAIASAWPAWRASRNDPVRGASQRLAALTTERPPKAQGLRPRDGATVTEKRLRSARWCEPEDGESGPR